MLGMKTSFPCLLYSGVYVKNLSELKITPENKRRSTAKNVPKSTPKPKAKEVKSNKGGIWAVIVVIVIVAIAIISIQSGVFSPASGNSADETAALQTFNSFKSAIASHDAQAAIGLTVLHFLDHTDFNDSYIAFFTDMFSNNSLSFSASGIKAVDAPSMSPAQKEQAELLVTNITDQSKMVHIDEIVTGYVMITGTMSFSGIPDLPPIDDLLVIHINNGWYIVLES
jgi:hypothetical protein